MTKSVLVIDTPKGCYECSCNIADDDGDLWCTALWKKMGRNDKRQKWCPLRPFLLGEELRKFRGTIKDKNTLIGFNMAIAICNKYLGETE